MLLRKSLALLCIGTLLMGCKRDNIDLDLIDQLSFNPDVQIPLVNAKLSLSDIVQEDSTLIIDPNDQTIRIVYVEDSLFAFNAIDFIEIPDQDPAELALEESNLPFIALNLGLGTLGGAELTSVSFETGDLAYSINTATALTNDVDFRLRLTNASIAGQTFDTVVTLPAGSTSFDELIDIDGLNFDLSNGGTSVNYIEVFLGIENTAQTQDGQVFDFGVGLKNLSLNVAEGYFGTRPVNIPSGQFNFDLGGIEEFTNGLTLTDPSLTLIATSNLGIEIELAPNFNGVNGNNEIQSLGFQPQTVNAASSPNTPVVSRIEVNRNNSQIVPFMANIPNTILYSGQATINPGVNTANNFISQNASFELGMEVDIPLEFSAKNMMLEQRISDLNLTTGDTSSLIESLTLFFNNKNGFPFELALTVSFLDSVTGDSIEGVEIPLLEPAPIDQNGVVTQRTERQFNVTFDSEQVEKLSRVKDLLIRGRLSTPSDGTDPIRLLSSYGLQSIISARTKLNVTF
jgi:hypothetical protein